MTDQAPLLVKKPVPSSIEDTIESCIGSAGFCQVFQAILISMAWSFDAQQTFINVFTDRNPSWHCTNTDDSQCLRAIGPCGLPDGSWFWDQPHESIVSEWSLECSPPTLVGMPASTYFLGCLVGGLLFATLADSRLGRKSTLVLSCFAMSLSAALCAFSPNVWVYSALRFVCGLGRATISTSALVLATEIVAKKWRDRISILGFFFYTVGFLSLPAIAYLDGGSSWRDIYLWTSVPSFFYTVLIYFLIKKSPRWLLVRGRRDEAIDTLKSMAKSNGYTINSSFSNLSMVEENWNVDVFSALKILCTRRWAFKRLTAVMIVGFGVGLVYYGMPLNLGNLGSNLYMNVTINALAELPSALLTFFLIGSINRRCSLLVFTAVSGVTSLLCLFFRNHGWSMVAAEVVSFFSACTAFNVLLIYGIELFPTCIRNSAISMVRQAIVIGGVFVPLLVALGRKKMFFSFGVFGLVIGCCGLFAACLPETRGSTMSDTVEEEEYKEIVSSNTNP